MLHKKVLILALLTLFLLAGCNQERSVMRTQEENHDMNVYYATLLDNHTIEIMSQVAFNSTPKLTLLDHTLGQEMLTTTKKHPSKLIHQFSLPQKLSALNHHYSVRLEVDHQTQEIPLRFFKYYDHQDFITQYIPAENLAWGAIPSTTSTTFRVWSPTASEISLNIYPSGDSSSIQESYTMQALAQGVWELVIPQNMEGLYYTYTVTNAKESHEITDPYAISAGINGRRALITTPATAFNAKEHKDTFVNVAPIDAVLYELHVRDLSMSPTTNHSDALRGKFLGVVQPNTKNRFGQSTGIDHIKDLGVTHIHFLPIFDYNSIDEGNLSENRFNWGYDPLNYSVPEGSYSTNPADGYVRMQELRTMVESLHNQNIGVVMDVVYNHTGPVTDHFFQHLVPDYYFRMNEFGTFSNGSGTGNETASERIMFRQYMIDSLKHWMNTYKIDGFRFDLMAIHDIDTMNRIAQELKAINPNVIIYGEGWTGGGSPLPAQHAAIKNNSHLMPDIAVFNDDIRDGIKGWVFDASEKGFVNGNPDPYPRALFGYLGALVKVPQHGDAPYANTPANTIAYVSAHDNHTLFDRFTHSVPDESFEEYMRMQIMANAMVLTSPGIPFLHAGVEMMRTKDGDENSYKSPDSINQLDYDRKNDTLPVYDYYKNLINIRKNHPLFKQGLLADGTHAFHLLKESNADDLFMAFKVIDHTNKDNWQGVYLLFNAGEKEHTVPLSAGNWSLFADTWQVIPQLKESTYTESITISPNSIAMLYQPK